MDMAIPDEFKAFCRYFHQDVGPVHSTREGNDRVCLGINKPGAETRRAAVLKRIVERASYHMPHEIKQVWWEPPAEIPFPEDGDLLTFLQLIRDAMGVAGG